MRFREIEFMKFDSGFIHCSDYEKKWRVFNDLHRKSNYVVFLCFALREGEHFVCFIGKC